jgi:hypothetical protein
MSAVYFGGWERSPAPAPVAPDLPDELRDVEWLVAREATTFASSPLSAPDYELPLRTSTTAMRSRGTVRRTRRRRWVEPADRFPPRKVPHLALGTAGSPASSVAAAVPPRGGPRRNLGLGLVEVARDPRHSERRDAGGQTLIHSSRQAQREGRQARPSHGTVSATTAPRCSYTASRDATCRSAGGKQASPIPLHDRTHTAHSQ